MGGREPSSVEIQHGSNANTGGREGGCQEVGAVIRPFAFLDIEGSPLLAELRCCWLPGWCCEYMVEYYIASNSDVTTVPLLRRGSWEMP